MSVHDSGRYSDAEWERTRQEALAAAGEPAPQRMDHEHSPATLVPGIVRMSLRGDPADVERVVAILDAAKAKVWRGDNPGTKSGNEAGFRYFTVQVDRDG